MDKKINTFIKGNRISVLTTLLKDGSPHSATLHYSHQDKPLRFFVSTENTSRKCQGLLDGKEIKGSMVIGFSEEEFITFQMEGTVRAVTDKKELAGVHKIHYAKYPDGKKWKDDPATIFLVFKPNWWRYTEYKPKFLVLSS